VLPIIPAVHLLVDILAIAYRTNLDQKHGIGYLVDHSVVPNASAPKIGGAAKLLSSRRPRILSERLDPWKDAVERRVWKLLEFLARGSDKSH